MGFPNMPQAAHIVCVGDSLTQGFGHEGYPASLQRMLQQQRPDTQWLVKNAGRASATVSDWLKQYLDEGQFLKTLASGCDVCIIMLGTNDARYDTMASGGFSEQAFMASLTQVVRRVQQVVPSAKMMLAIPPPVGNQAGWVTSCFNKDIIHGALPRLIPQLAASLGIPYADCFNPCGGVNANDSLFSDGIHLWPEGERILAAAIIPVLQSCLAAAGAGRPAPGGGRPAPAEVTPSDSRQLMQKPFPTQLMGPASMNLPIGGSQQNKPHTPRQSSALRNNPFVRKPTPALSKPEIASKNMGPQSPFNIIMSHSGPGIAPMVPQVKTVPPTLPSHNGPASNIAAPMVRSGTPLKQRMQSSGPSFQSSTLEPKDKYSLAYTTRQETPMKQRPTDSDVSVLVSDVVSRVPRTISFGQAKTPRGTLPPPAMSALPPVPRMPSLPSGMGLLQAPLSGSLQAPLTAARGGSLQAPLSGLSGSLQAPVSGPGGYPGSARAAPLSGLSGSLQAPVSGPGWYPGSARAAPLSGSLQAPLSGSLQAPIIGSGRYPVSNGSVSVPVGGAPRFGSMSIPVSAGSVTVPVGGLPRCGSMSPFSGHAPPSFPGASPMPTPRSGSYAPPPAGLAGALPRATSFGSYAPLPAGLAGAALGGSLSIPSSNAGSLRMSSAPPTPITSTPSASHLLSRHEAGRGSATRTRSSSVQRR